MDWLRQRALLSGSCLWRDEGDEPWVVAFDFAEVNDRLECVGMRMRSFLGAVERDDLGEFVAYFVGEVTRDDLLAGTKETPSLYDADGWDAVLCDERGWAPKQSPRALYTTTIRGLPLTTLMAIVRRRVAASWRSGLVAPRTAVQLIEEELPETHFLRLGASSVDSEEDLERRTWQMLRAVRDKGGWDDSLMKERDELAKLYATRDAIRSARRGAGPAKVHRMEIDAESFLRLTQQAAASYSPPGQKAGRPSKYSMAQLEMVARTYREASISGSRSPTADVAERLGFTHSQAAKLVMRCRNPLIGLLGPTKRRQAGGVEMPLGDRNEGTS